MRPPQHDSRGIVFFRYQGGKEGDPISGERGYDAQRTNQVDVAAQHVEDGDYFHSFAKLPLAGEFLHLAQTQAIVRVEIHKNGQRSKYDEAGARDIGRLPRAAGRTRPSATKRPRSWVNAMTVLRN